MAKIYITELANITASDSGASMPVAALPGLAEQVVAVGSASAQSAAFNAATKFIRVVSDVPANIEVGLNPVATINTLYLAAGVPEYFGVHGLAKLAVIKGA